MPSWNIHIAHAEELFARNGALAAAVHDRNAFLFGSIVPDIPVGYMVPGIAEPIPYTKTHFAKPEHIPKPRESEFWDAYVAPVLKENVEAAGALDVPILTLAQERERLNRVHHPHRYRLAKPLPADDLAPLAATSANVQQSVRDMVLGAWVHLLADNIWNTRVNEFLDSIGGKPSEEFRIKKQRDFDQFGKTLSIESIVRASDRLVAAAQAFPQYAIRRDDTLYATGVIHEIVRTNPGSKKHAPYRLLNDEFFSATFAEVANKAGLLFKLRMID